MNLILLFIGTVMAVELFIQLPIVQSGRDIKSLIGKSTRVIFSKNFSDHWKEKVLVSYSGKILFSSISIFFFILLAISPIIILSFVGSVFDIDFYKYISSLTGISLSTAVAVAYYYIRGRIRHV